MRPAPSALLALALLMAAPALGQTAPPAHRLFLAPTARPLPAGGGAVGVVDLAVPTAAVGVGRGVTLGAGVVVAPVPGLAGIVLVEPRWTVWDRPALAVAVGVTARADPFRGGAVHAAPYVVATAGRGGIAGTVGVGARASVEQRSGPWSNLRTPTDWTPPGARGRTAHVVPAPAAFVGLEVRASERTTWIVEATAVPDQAVAYRYATVGGPEFELESGPVHYDATVGAGARVALGRASLDLGLVVGRDADGASEPAPIVAPWLNVTLGLGR